MREVLARVEAVLRRAKGASAEKKERRLEFDKLTIDMDSFELILVDDSIEGDEATQEKEYIMEWKKSDKEKISSAIYLAGEIFVYMLKRSNAL